MQVTNFQPKNRRADLIINRDITEEFTCANSVEKALSLDDYDLKFEIYDPTDGNVDTPILTKDCVRIDERSGSFKISNVVTPGEGEEPATGDYITLSGESYTYYVVRVNKTSQERILQQWGTLTVIDIDG